MSTLKLLFYLLVSYSDKFLKCASVLKLHGFQLSARYVRVEIIRCCYCCVMRNNVCAIN